MTASHKRKKAGVQAKQMLNADCYCSSTTAMPSSNRDVICTLDDSRILELPSLARRLCKVYFAGKTFSDFLLKGMNVVSHSWYDFEKVFATYSAWVDMLVRTDVILDDTAKRLLSCFADAFISKTSRLSHYSSIKDRVLERWYSLDRLLYFLMRISPTFPLPDPLARQFSEADKRCLKGHVLNVLYHKFTSNAVYSNAREIYFFMCDVFHSFGIHNVVIVGMNEALREQISKFWKADCEYLLNAMRWRFRMLRELGDPYATEYDDGYSCNQLSDFEEYLFIS